MRLCSSRRLLATRSGVDVITCHQRFDASGMARPYYGALLSPLALRSGMHVLDAGCSLGRRTAAICYQVGRIGSVVAVDDDNSVVKAARSNQGRERQIALGWVIPTPDPGDECIQCNGCMLKGEASIPQFEHIDTFSSLHHADGSFDCVVEDRVLQRSESPLQVVKELVRVLKPGGRFSAGVVAAMADRTDSDSQLASWLHAPLAFAAEELPTLLEEAGLEEVRLTSVPLGLAEARGTLGVSGSSVPAVPSTLSTAGLALTLLTCSGQKSASWQ